MKVKTVVTAFLTLGMISTSALAIGVNSGQVTFDGTVVDTPCNLMPGQDGEDVKVPFGQLSMAQLNAGQSAVRDFTINLEGCSLTTTSGVPPVSATKTVSITFNAMNTNAGNTLINAVGTATGLGIGIQGYTFGTESVLNGMHDGKNPLKFHAVAKKADTAAVTAGTFSAVSNFTISYR
ncbi:type 1 fimbrial protein [Salmonella enterica]|nr:type 1 fimbrial protein [Salmonella enterica]ECD4514769.1 type 1 fimbrial protein [Salmonella enterica subsp. enterica serovar Sandiego]ECF1356167.1 type 1 fimbrial protein [Salmonella enterica subsp. enterica serovar Sandiego]ECV4068484.1 type 1 fimbrial protein [Salmonella enterica]ECZ0995781.1 type 1 fimbrial protein [Salmonella enterica]